MNCVQALQQAASEETQLDRRYMLASAGTLLETTIAEFCANPCLETMIDLNGVWAYARRVLQAARPSTPEPTKAVA